MKWLALDIGGANLKSADGQGFAASRHFPLWQQSARLPEALRTIIAEAPPSDHLAVTMTGELADCYRTKTEGVMQILDAVDAAADQRHTRVYLTDGRLVTPAVARSMPSLVAASNWHALASFAGRYARRGQALMIDIGTTTCDLIAMVDGHPQAAGKTDPERLLSGELIYSGVERSPICAVTPTLPWGEQQCPVAHEVFATTIDAYVLLGDLPENPKFKFTSDNRPATREFAHDRLARAVCADRTTFSSQDALQAAKAIREAQVELMSKALAKVLARQASPPTTIVISGRGEFLAWRLISKLKLTAAVISLNDELGGLVSRCAPAHALAVLASEKG
jgi:(4-(4-[2-(gamma-L-glutamylamino)ethyl]phenoxymethyl)furan-2-yl)methanamine synthase